MEALVEAGDAEGAARLISDDMLERFVFAGDPTDIIAHCERLYAAGATRIELGTPHGAGEAATGIRLIGERVLPGLRGYLSP